ncbi:hypothetical protein WH47_02328 [Habropoda laboriosa]|uniref:Uncharacterized protein n=1 Tax=Habropoda laboriosa TaxID=597456 RepID=A0A0L7QZM8_9HYME|nr:hypothetical protein WH47_02328 [Habropoda laboriosa]
MNDYLNILKKYVKNRDENLGIVDCFKFYSNNDPKHTSPVAKFLFPRINYKDYFVRGGPLRSSSDANKSGCMKEESFIKVAKHFVQYMKPSKKKEDLIIRVIGEIRPNLCAGVIENRVCRIHSSKRNRGGHLNDIVFRV